MSFSWTHSHTFLAAACPPFTREPTYLRLGETGVNLAAPEEARATVRRVLQRPFLPRPGCLLLPRALITAEKFGFLSRQSGFRGASAQKLKGPPVLGPEGLLGGVGGSPAQPLLAASQRPAPGPVSGDGDDGGPFSRGSQRAAQAPATAVGAAECPRASCCSPCSRWPALLPLCLVWCPDTLAGRLGGPQGPSSTAELGCFHILISP